MKLCVAQTDIVWESKAENLLRCGGLMRTAADNGAELILFPELSVTGFSMNAALAEPPGGETETRFRELSEQAGIAVGFGFACRSGEVVTNRYCIAQNGNIIAAYDKIHPFSYGGECEVYTGGDRLVTFELSGVKTGVTICYDLRFPELYQALSRECELIINAANWPAGRREHWQTLLKARAIENQCYIAGCNRCGSGGGLEYSGDSAVYSPSGELIAAAEPYSERLIYAETDPEECRRIRADFPVKNDRRNELYRDFYVK